MQPSKRWHETLNFLRETQTSLLTWRLSACFKLINNSMIKTISLRCLINSWEEGSEIIVKFSKRGEGGGGGGGILKYPLVSVINEKRDINV